MTEEKGIQRIDEDEEAAEDSDDASEDLLPPLAGPEARKERHFRSARQGQLHVLRGCVSGPRLHFRRLVNDLRKNRILRPHHFRHGSGQHPVQKGAGRIDVRLLSRPLKAKLLRSRKTSRPKNLCILASRRVRKVRDSERTFLGEISL